MSDRITVDIDIRGLDEILAKLDGAIAGRTPEAPLQWRFIDPASGRPVDEVMERYAMDAWDERFFPAINREVRLIFGSIPGVRQMMRYNFMLRRMERGFKLGGGAQLLALGATVIYLLRFMNELHEEIKQMNTEYDNMLMQVTSANLKQIRSWMDDQGEEPYKSVVAW